MKISKQSLVAAVSIVLIIGISVYISLSLKKTPQVNFVSVTRTDIAQAVKVDGTVMSAEDLGLAFQQGGIVSQILVKEGATVKAGQALVKLDTSDASAALSQANASLAIAQANYNKVISGASNEDVAAAQVALDNANTLLINTTKQQQVLVNNANNALLNSGFSAIPGSGNSDSVTATVSGAYTGTAQGTYKITIYATGSGQSFQTTGLENSTGLVSTAAQPLGTKGLFIQFSSTNFSTNDTWSVAIPNTQASTYTSNYNAYQAALQTQTTSVAAAQSAVDSAKAALNLKQAQARPADVQAAQAQVAAASALVQAAQNSFSKNILTAPIDGVITSVVTKVGQTVAGSTLAPGIPAIKMISNQKFQIQTYITEADVAKIKVGDSATVNLDAYGSGTNFNATVIAIDPAATITNGVSTYKTTLEFAQDDARIKSGMGASVLISDAVHTGALTIPATAIIKKGADEFVLTDAGNGKTSQTKIQTGIVSADGNVEVLSGLSEGQRVASFGNQ